MTKVKTVTKLNLATGTPPYQVPIQSSLVGPIKPPPPPVYGNIARNALRVGGKGIAAGLVSLVGDLLFPEPVAKSDLSSINPALLNKGTRRQIQEEVLGDPPFLGGQVAGVRYKFRVRYDTYLNDNPWVVNRRRNLPQTAVVVGFRLTPEQTKFLTELIL